MTAANLLSVRRFPSISSTIDGEKLVPPTIVAGKLDAPHPGFEPRRAPLALLLVAATELESGYV